MMETVMLEKRHRGHKLAPDSDGMVQLQLIQAAAGAEAFAKRQLPPAVHASSSDSQSESHKEECEEILNSVQESAEEYRRTSASEQSALKCQQTSTLAVMSYHPGLGACEALLTEVGKLGAVVALGGIRDKKNITYVSTNGNLEQQEKLSLASEDKRDGVNRGTRLDLYIGNPESGKPVPVRWAVLNCHDYTHVDILQVLLEEQIEVLIVVSYNPATRLYWQYALADVHRLFCYVVIANVAELGGSGVFAPFRRMGAEENAKFSAGGQIFGSRGPAKFAVDFDLNIQLLRDLRKSFGQKGFAALKEGSRGREASSEGNAGEAVPSTSADLDAMVPSQHFMNTEDGQKVGPPCVTQIDELAIDWRYDNVRLVIAQLDHMGLDAYIESGYRLDQPWEYGRFEKKLEHWLDHVELQCERQPAPSGRLLDILVFPEVFIPRAFLEKLQKFSDRTGAMILAGVGYPENDNVNECVVLRPKEEAHYYRKITRSQYDGMLDDGKRMPMTRGEQLLRLVDKKGRGLGLLVCYDYSHLNLMSMLNLLGRKEPLELMVVVAHNPFSELYRSCCIADAHRFYQYVAMCNVAEFGGSGVFGPLRTSGARQVLAEAGKGTETMLVVNIDLKGLRKARASTDEQLLDNKFQRRPGAIDQRFAEEKPEIKVRPLVRSFRKGS